MVSQNEQKQGHKWHIPEMAGLRHWKSFSAFMVAYVLKHIMKK
jgi:hypothetical protein